MSDVQKFHDHLDGCSQCRNHPMALCAKGHAILHGLPVQGQTYTERLDWLENAIAVGALREAVEKLRNKPVTHWIPTAYSPATCVPGTGILVTEAERDAILAASPDAPEPRRCQKCGGSGYENRMAEPARICTRCHKTGIEPDAPEPGRDETCEATIGVGDGTLAHCYLPKGHEGLHHVGDPPAATGREGEKMGIPYTLNELRIVAATAHDIYHRDLMTWAAGEIAQWKARAESAEATLREREEASDRAANVLTELMDVLISEQTTDRRLAERVERRCAEIVRKYKLPAPPTETNRP